MKEESYFYNHSNYENSQMTHFNNKNNVLINNIMPNNINIFYHVLSSSTFFKNLISYLNLIDLAKLRSINQKFRSLIHNYYPERFLLEINSVISYQSLNENLVLNYMNNIEEQIPLSINNWLDLNLNIILNNIKLIDNITKIKNLKFIENNPDIIFAPFCILFGFDISNDIKFKDINWKNHFYNIITNPNINNKINNFDYENLNENEIMEILSLINNFENKSYFSNEIENLIKWYKSVVSYHILIHPYTYRNNQGTIKQYSNEYYFAKKMEKKINKIYKFKKFLNYLGILNTKLGEFIFNVQRAIKENKEKNNNNYNINNFKDDYNMDNPKVIGNILSYLTIDNSSKCISVSKNFYKGFIESIDITLFNLLKDIFFFKAKLYNSDIDNIPQIYSHTIYSKFFLMLDILLNNSCFLNKDEIDSIKNIRSNNNIYINEIANIFDMLTSDNKNSKNKNFLEKIKNLSKKEELEKKMKECQKLNFPQTKILEIYQKLKKYLNLDMMEKIKRLNKGMYMILIWEVFIIQYLQMYNIFDFINNEYIENNFNNEQKGIIQYYIKLMNYLKYLLKIKFHFSKKYDFQFLTQKLINYLIKNQLSEQSNKFFQSTNNNWENVAAKYFSEYADTYGCLNIFNKNNILQKILKEIINDHQNYLKPIANIIKNKNNNKSTFLNKNYKNKEENNKTNIPSYRNNELEYPSFMNDSQILNNNKDNQFSQINKSSGKIYYPSKSQRNKNIFYYPKYRKNKNNFEIIELFDIPDIIIISNILLYLDLNSLFDFSQSNHLCSYYMKTHIFLRTHIIEQKKNIIENENNVIINLITSKRNNYYNSYKIRGPSKEHAIKLINRLKIDDLQEIREYYKKYNKTSEKIISPFVLLLGYKPIIKTNSNGEKYFNYYEVAKNLLFGSDNNIVKILSSIELELIPSDIIRKVDDILKEKCFRPEYMKNLSPCFSKMISWCIGILEFHRVLRKYSINNCDIDILKQNEINFCYDIDKIISSYFKLLRFQNYFCQDYQKYAQKILDNVDN